jgi:formylglycine-generating enzyme required for sulfatase activity
VAIDLLPFRGEVRLHVTFAKRKATKAGVRAQRAGSSRGLRGGNWNNNSNNLAASNRNNNPTNENNNIGFRVASS